MKLQFTKYHGTGNDFIMIDSRINDISDRSVDTISKLCDRHFGIGGDGLIVLEESEQHDFKMRYYNSDGRPGTMCGNGGRSATAFAKAQGWISGSCQFEAADGLHTASVLPDGRITLSLNDVVGVEILQLPATDYLSMASRAGDQATDKGAADDLTTDKDSAANRATNEGAADNQTTDEGSSDDRTKDEDSAANRATNEGAADNQTTHEVGVNKSAADVRAANSNLPDTVVQAYFLNTGSPHLVLFVDEIDKLDVYVVGRKLRYDERFPEGTNVNFVQRTSKGIRVRTYERGVENETLSCGTGVTASAIAASLRWPKITPPVKVNTLGGNLEVNFVAGADLTSGSITGTTATTGQASDTNTGISPDVRTSSDQRPDNKRATGDQHESISGNYSGSTPEGHQNKSKGYHFSDLTLTGPVTRVFEGRVHI